jgi:hypothetical protein
MFEFLSRWRQVSRARMELTLLSILIGKGSDPQKVIQFVCVLIAELLKRQSFKSFFSENLSLISMKIAEQGARREITTLQGIYRSIRKDVVPKSVRV